MSILDSWAGSTRHCPTDKVQEDWWVMMREKLTLAWHRGLVVMTLHKVRCDPCCCEAITHCEGRANAPTWEWRASRLGCRDSAKALRGRETTRLVGWISDSCCRVEWLRSGYQALFHSLLTTSRKTSGCQLLSETL